MLFFLRSPGTWNVGPSKADSKANLWCVLNRVWRVCRNKLIKSAYGLCRLHQGRCSSWCPQRRCPWLQSLSMESYQIQSTSKARTVFHILSLQVRFSCTNFCYFFFETGERCHNPQWVGHPLVINDAILFWFRSRLMCSILCTLGEWLIVCWAMAWGTLLHPLRWLALKSINLRLHDFYYIVDLLVTLRHKLVIPASLYNLKIIHIW